MIGNLWYFLKMGFDGEWGLLAGDDMALDEFICSLELHKVNFVLLSKG